MERGGAEGAGPLSEASPSSSQERGGCGGGAADGQEVDLKRERELWRQNILTFVVAPPPHPLVGGRVGGGRERRSHLLLVEKKHKKNKKKTRDSAHLAVINQSPKLLSPFLFLFVPSYSRTKQDVRSHWLKHPDFDFVQSPLPPPGVENKHCFYFIYFVYPLALNLLDLPSPVMQAVT